MILISTASVALLLVGVLTIAVTPSSTTPSDRAAAPAGAGASPAPADPPSSDSPVALAAAAGERLGGDSYVVTPIAAGYGLTTRSALTDPDATPRLPSGNVIQLAVLAEVGPVAVVSIPTIDIVPLGIAPALGGQPGDVDERFVVVDGATLPYIAEHHDELLEGAPVVDGHGALIGLITYTAAGPEMMAISINEELAPPLAFYATVSTAVVATTLGVGSSAPSESTATAATAADAGTAPGSSVEPAETTVVDTGAPLSSGELAASDAAR